MRNQIFDINIELVVKSKSITKIYLFYLMFKLYSEYFFEK